ncbi:NAD(P)/FAD-dependent oxidoreductase [Streptomyces californicus]|uniref:FAD-dependent oxidoreductase n=1 Tax=Streptomyces violaceoruber TaxID=1935 RepID=A0A1V0UH85_STRVN|nr:MULTISPECIES: FAD-dependent oxidoreductase [Streptomyces]MYW79113.1 FAD-dependent oxidoreductase [Streptomyces sp. SID8369]ARF64613.1 FAD-dependent oxidoreductase [Streptomyces violaceoruber]KOU10628.1 FAD-dependent oxidoreductase [Streptomyces sp. NRRL F-2295]MDW4916856.1 FAD-dependent oxidoreductase [Streptomyces californicus]SDE25189.1 Glycine/D-amino acid oxidase (deaminating) [Streptomyces sp. LaPpAH-199]
MAPAAMRTAASSLSGAKPVPFWLDDPERPDALPALTGDEHTDLLVVGGGYSGLWTALIAKERDPDRDVVLIEGHEVGWAASGRNGGFCAASLTHGLANGVERWPDEIAKLEELGERNLDAIEAAVARYGIDCEFERTGEIDVATEPHQLQELREWHEEIVKLGITGVDFLDRDALRAEVDSPTFLGGLWDRRGVAMLHPAKLAWGLKRACRELGVRIYEHTRGLELARSGEGMAVRTPYGRVFARRVALGTNIFPSLVKRVRPYTVPVYDYALMTEPLTPAQLESIGWKGRQGLGDSANQFHYFRLSADNRILWGGYDAIYPYGGKLNADLDQRPETFLKLAEQFFTCFPQLSGVRFSHAWGGAIDTCSRFTAFFGTAHQGRVAYAAGYTGLGVGSTRFGADVMLDLLSGEETERTRLEMVRSKPMPFPPEPFAWAGIEITRRSLAHADDNGGRRNLWLKTMDKLGLGFDS